MTKSLFLLTALTTFGLFGSSPATAEKVPPNPVTVVRGNLCQPGLHHQPGGPFAVLVFCEDALGAYAAVICLDTGQCEASRHEDEGRFTGWSLDNRTWQEPLWATDIDSFAWSPDGDKLFIATNNIYGTGGLFRLALESRNVEQLLPGERDASESNPGPGYTIVSISDDASTLTYRYDLENGAPLSSIGIKEAP